jgi:cytochrome c oxidase assembly protein subunit 15
MLKSLKSHRRLAIATILYTLAVILWGAWVRITGSGAGCGDHWPLCNGVVIPRSPTLETVIEFTHRVTSGLLLILMAAWVTATFRVFAKGHPARLAVVWSAIFLVIEALLGAGLVIFEMVADNPSVARGWWMAAHLANTFILIGWMVLAAWYGRAPEAARGLGLRRAGAWKFIAALLLLILAGSSGAVAALGNTLFPAETLSAGIAMDFNPDSHILVRLRVWHPVLAIVTALWLLWVAVPLASDRRAAVRKAAVVVGGLVSLQVVAGFVNLLLLGPVWMQLTHLLLADCLWMATVVLAAAALSSPAQPLSMSPSNP